jgi:endonuclease-3
MPLARKRTAPSLGPLGETRKDMSRRAATILRALRRAYPDAHIPLLFTNPLELLIGTILAAQCTDKKVNEITATLFQKYRTAADWAAAPLAELEQEVRPTGFYRSKARSIHESADDLVRLHGGDVPDTIEELTALRGVGRKTANVVLSYAFGKPAIIVDTHFIRLTKRMGLTGEFEPGKIEADLARIVPEKDWSAFSLAITWHGRVTCFARRPDCAHCVVRDECPAAASGGVVTWKVKAPGKPSTARRAAGRRTVEKRSTGKPRGGRAQKKKGPER